MELIKQQNSNSEALQQAIKNYKKSPTDRKTKSYLEQQLAKITDLWNRVNTVDNQIRRDTTIAENHEYFTSNLYSILGNMFNEISSTIQGEIEAYKKKESQQGDPSTFPGTSKGSQPKTTSAALKLPLKLQRAVQAVNTLIQQASQECENWSHQLMAMKLRTIEQHWKLVQQLHEKLWSTSDDDYDLEEFIRQEALINDGILKLSEYLNSKNTTESHNNEQVSMQENSVKLPNIELPKFDGNSLKWRQFRDLFIEVVHNQRLSNCQKFYYLKGSLTGEAARLIQHFPTTSENYSAAWQVIEGRYENKRLLVGAVLQRLLTQQPVHKESSASIKLLHDTTLECLLGIKALGIKTEEWDPIIVYIISQLLDRQTQMLWEQSIKNPRELPKLQELMKFLESRFQTMEMISPIKKGMQSHSLITTVEVCIACKQAHALYHCQKFLNMKVRQRLQLVQSAKYCVNCLKADHKTAQCSSNKSCKQCQRRHNTLLHLDQQKSSKAERAPTITNSSPAESASLLTATERENTAVLLSTVILIVDDIYGNPVECRAILDNGSQVHIMTEKFATKLGLPRINHQYRIQGIGESQRCTSKRINIQISSRVTSFTSRIEALVLPTIVSHQPKQFVPVEEWKIPQNIPLADPQFNIPSEIDMLIGSGLFYSILSVGQIRLTKKSPILQNTLFGWIVGGEYSVKTNATDLTCGMVTEEGLYSSLEKFWEIEECRPTTRPMTTSEVKCEKHFASQHKRGSDGRYIVRLPFQEEVSSLGQSYGIAQQRLLAVERRLAKDEILKYEYIKFMHEYQRLGHMEEIDATKVKEPHYFLPHHAVMKPDSTTTKVRVVFDASAKT